MLIIVIYCLIIPIGISCIIAGIFVSQLKESPMSNGIHHSLGEEVLPHLNANWFLDQVPCGGLTSPCPLFSPTVLHQIPLSTLSFHVLMFVIMPKALLRTLSKHMLYAL